MSPARRPTDTDQVRIPADLAGPVEVALAKSVDQIPGPRAMPGGSRYEVKWDGYRVAIVRRGQAARLWTRNRSDITDRFPDIAAAAILQVPDGVVLDGELVILGADGRLSFDALQQRLVTSPAKARAKAAELPASYAAFDVLATGGVDLRTQRWTVRRQRLEQLSKGWVPPLQLTPVTDDVDEATEWFEVLPAAMGVEGLVVKGAASRYTPGRRDAWVKLNSAGVHRVRSELARVLIEVSALSGVPGRCATGVADGGEQRGPGQSAPPVASLGRLATGAEGECLVGLNPVELSTPGPNGVAQLMPGSVLAG
ncbi:ATP-dependent DNA ligase [Kribbella jiaozuonensis]|uniref:ATP-dependent DNA ligase n=1 Tax=Kribbella jiaozuonensis TaxID=2575441 RepID=UPI001F3A26B1|nr:RNA ligase family protein [Kribbella jiaozuonensis]